MSAANALTSEQTPKLSSDARAAEPSMEDILASIRRIIADDQSRSLASAGTAQRRTALPPLTPAPAARRDSPPARVRAETPAPPPVAAPEPAAAPVSRPELDLLVPLGRTVAQPHLNAPPVPLATEDLSVIADIVNAGAAAIFNTAAHPGERSEPMSQRPAPTPHENAAPAVLSLDGYEAAADAGRPHVIENGAETASAETLVSNAVGATIESTFQTLATSVFLQNTAAVESLTREMLRPMLKTWLDDNLPTIVERLVRVEIERVARGVRG